MARIIETPKEFEITCPHCLKRIAFSIEDVWSSYTRGLEDSDGWCDPDCVWNYIDCPNCKKTVAVDSAVPTEVYRILERKYENDLDY